MARKPREVISAGGVIINDAGEILFCHPTGSRWNNWRLPKGVVDEGEAEDVAALREVLEETGYKCEIVAPLTTECRYRSSDRLGSCMKTLKMFLMRPIEKIQDPDWENDQFKWVSIREREATVSTREKELIEEAVEIWSKVN
jgi:8-oxo-dGTP pyrophosphatase MutT (NUDIX family)